MNEFIKSEDSRYILSSEAQLRKIVREELTQASKVSTIPTKQRFVNSEEFRELVGCSRSYEHKIRKEGRIPFGREGRTIKYLLSDVEKFIQRPNKKAEADKLRP